MSKNRAKAGARGPMLDLGEVDREILRTVRETEGARFGRVYQRLIREDHEFGNSEITHRWSLLLARGYLRRTDDGEVELGDRALEQVA